MGESLTRETIREVLREVALPQPSSVGLPEAPARVIETRMVQPLVPPAAAAASIERIESRTEHTERVVERLVEREIERERPVEAAVPPAPFTPPPAPFTPPPAPRAAAVEREKHEEQTPGPPLRTPPAPQPKTRHAPPVVRPAPPYEARPAARSVQAPRRTPAPERKVEVRIGAIEIRANTPPPAEPPAAGERPAAENFDSYRRLRDYSGWFRG
ncbi:MAG: hypothetical protein IT159_02255 [Bryobacterales bacterium]|nr:hypothetical protein [Bryobacterales bacterium]